MRFLDGSLDDETTIYRQGRAFHFISDHHIQRGPSFSKPVDVTIDAARSLVVTNDANGRKTQAHVDMPPEVYNGLATTLLMNWRPSMPEMKIAVVVAAASPRIVHLSIKPVGKVPVTIGGMSRTTTDYLVHVELGGVAGVIAPLLVREPLDHHVLILSGDDPAFIREEGTLYEGGPVLRIQQISAVFGD